MSYSRNAGVSVGKKVTRWFIGESDAAAEKRLLKYSKENGLRRPGFSDIESTSSLPVRMWESLSTGTKKLLGYGALGGGLFAGAKGYEAINGKPEPTNIFPQSMEDLQKMFGAGSLIFGLGLGAMGAFVDPTIGAALAVVGGLAGQPILNAITGEKTDTKPASTPTTTKPVVGAVAALENAAAPVVETMRDVVSSSVTPAPTPITEAARAAASTRKGS